MSPLCISYSSVGLIQLSKSVIHMYLWAYFMLDVIDNNINSTRKTVVFFGILVWDMAATWHPFQSLTC